MEIVLGDYWSVGTQTTAKIKMINPPRVLNPWRVEGFEPLEGWLTLMAPIVGIYLLKTSYQQRNGIRDILFMRHFDDLMEVSGRN